MYPQNLVIQSTDVLLLRVQSTSPKQPSSANYSRRWNYNSNESIASSALVWGRFLQLAKGITGSTQDFKPHTFPTLRCATVLADTITQMTGIENKRLRKELQDISGKLLDSSVGHVGRAYGFSSWVRRSVNEAISTNRTDSRAPVSRDTNIDQKLNTSTTSNTPRPGATNEVAIKINESIATVALLLIRCILIDNDKAS
ncbi:hypothetical protein F5877DRAFT_72731 [Lentinula edodes]|nr:hypothetical protein F5877DRAFT_72731 [Lentinula edodes]